ERIERRERARDAVHRGRGAHEPTRAVAEVANVVRDDPDGAHLAPNSRPTPKALAEQHDGPRPKAEGPSCIVANNALTKRAHPARTGAEVDCARERSPLVSWCWHAGHAQRGVDQAARIRRNGSGLACGSPQPEDARGREVHARWPRLERERTL